MKKAKLCLIVALIASAVGSVRVYSGCDSTEWANFSTTTDSVNCVIVTTYNRKCAAPNPDDWSQGCDEVPGKVRQDTWQGTMGGFNLNINICGYQIGTCR